MSQHQQLKSSYNEVFISYSRKNSDFVQKIVDSIRDSGRDNIWVDWEDIEIAEDWWSKIEAGIDSADNFLFILTPASAQSKVCKQEVEYAKKAGKRIIPILHIEIADEDETEIHLAIKRQNWLSFKESDDFDAGMAQLIETIETDLVYKRLHTRLLTRAREWEESGDNDAYLLSSGEVLETQSWLTRTEQETKSPSITKLQRSYVSTSQVLKEKNEAEQARIAKRVQDFQRASLVLVILVVLFVFVAISAVLATLNAQNRTAEAESIGATVEWNATLFAMGQERVATLAAGGAIVVVDELIQNPVDFVATMTQVQELNTTWEQLIQPDAYDIDMVLVPAGCFWMGSVFQPDEQPINQVCFNDDFWIDRYEVSRGQFETIGGIVERENTWQNADQPRTDITWFEAQAFCALRDARLPTEAEWEYAARGPDSLIYPWGNRFIEDYVAFNSLTESADTNSNQYEDGASWVGATHMSGNVWEWTNTIYDSELFPYPYRFSDGRERYDGIATWRVLRGGGFIDIPLEYPIRPGFRGSQPPDFSDFLTGFRCARSSTENNIMELTPLPLINDE